MKKINVLLAICTLLSIGAVSAQEKNTNEYKTILKRPVVSNQHEMEEKANIKELIEFERFSRDNGLWDEMKKCYAEDSRVNISWYQGSGHGFVEATSKMETTALHKAHNTEIWVKGDKAVAMMTATIDLQHHIGQYPVELVSDVILIFRTQKIDGQWYIVSFESIYQKDDIIPAFPNAEISIPAEEISQYRKSYGSMIYLMRKANFKIDENLPGTDRPDLVEKLYRETDEWLSD